MNLLTIFVIGIQIIAVLTVIVAIMSERVLAKNNLEEDQVDYLKKYNTLLVVYGVVTFLMCAFILIMRNSGNSKAFRF